MELPRWLCLAITLCGLSLLGCDAEQLLDNLSKHSSVQPKNEVDTSSQGGTVHPIPYDTDLITVASFNIQVFGNTKAGKPHVMQIIAEVARRFDVLAVQEIRSKDEQLVGQLVELINSNGANYDWIVGPRIGRTSSKEQYAYIFNAERISLVAGSAFTMADPQELLHREPLVATFRVLGVPTNTAFDFTLINVHTDPDEVDQELDVLGFVFMAVQRDGGQDDVILLGDLNANEKDLGRLGQIQGIQWAIAGQTTNTRRTKGYDNILFDRRFTSEFSGSGGVLDLMNEFGLDENQALEVSDHFPVWAAFSAYESAPTGPVAARSEPAPR